MRTSDCTISTRRALAAAVTLLPPGAQEAAAGRSPLAWILAGFLAIGALYLVIRLLELDLTNKETPHQEDPLRDDSRET